MNNYVKTFEEFTKKKLSKLKKIRSCQDNVAEEEGRIQQQQEMAQRGAANLDIVNKF